MKKFLYVLIPSGAIVLILLNAFFGHLLFQIPYEQDINKYSIYVHFQSGWSSSPRNILFEITNVWSNPEINNNLNTFNYDPFISENLLIDHNYNQLQFQNKKSFVELKHEFSNCETSWKPILYRHVVDMIRNNIEYLQGNQLNIDPYVQTFPDVSNKNYDSETQRELVKNGFIQFIPICTSQETTSYDFSVSINDDRVGFDVYFVPSGKELENFIENHSFQFYQEKNCFATNKNSISGSCHNVNPEAGLLIFVPDALELSVTKIKINLHEII